MHSVRKSTLTNSPIYADDIDPTRPAILDTPNTDALRTVGNSSAVQMYTMKNVKVLKNFPIIARVVVNQLRAVNTW